jgi:hypothetical protein
LLALAVSFLQYTARGCIFTHPRLYHLEPIGQQGGDSILAHDMEKSGHSRIPVEWPVTIVTNQTLINGETKIVTDAGFFLHCEEKLSRNGFYQIILRPPNQNPVLTKGQLIWSNVDIAARRGIVSGNGFYFAKIDDGDRHLLKDVISDALKPKPANQSP